jgi:hypothetical protein
MEKAAQRPHTVDGLKIGKYVGITFQQIRNLITERELEKLQTKEYTKLTFNIQYPLLLKRLTETDIKCERYWKKSFRINEESYYLCSEWYERHWDPFLKWSKKYKEAIE